MSHPDDDTRSSTSAAAGKPTLEALLRLKRSEKPDDLFWEQFDHRLRQKQLAAIIEPRPWWLGLVLVGRRFAPAGLPLSTAAAALVAVIALRSESPFASAPAPAKIASVAHVARTPGVPAEARATAPLSVVRDDSATSDPLPVESGSDSSEASGPAAPLGLESAVGAIAAADAGSAAPAVVDTSVVETLLEIATAPANPTASERTIEENLAVLRAEQPEFASTNLPLSPQGGAALEADASEPVLKMEVRNPRHARVLLAMADNPAVETARAIGHLRDGLARSLDDEDSLVGSASRLGVGGDRFSVSF